MILTILFDTAGSMTTAIEPHGTPTPYSVLPTPYLTDTTPPAA